LLSAFAAFAVGFNRRIKRIERSGFSHITHWKRNGAKAVYRLNFYPSAKADGKAKQSKAKLKLRQMIPVQSFN